jgi:2-furoyl-CoA dehydrogenase large subunit
MSAPVAIANAVSDALAHLDIIIDELPLSPNRIWKLLSEAKEKVTAP